MLIAIAMISQAVAQPSVPAPPMSVSIGPFQMGMTFAEARAAAPHLAWTDVTVDPVDKSRFISAPAAVEMFGFVYDIRMAPGYYGSYEMSLRHASQVQDEAECAERAGVLVAELEDRYGAFAPDAAPKEQGFRYYNSAVKIGRRSQLLWARSEIPGWSQWLARSANTAGAAAVEINIKVYFAADAPAGQKSICHSSIVFKSKGGAPESEEISVEQLRPVAMPSIAMLHESLEGVDLPTDGVVVPARCLIDRIRGALKKCSIDSKVSAGAIQAIQRRMGAMRYDSEALQPGNPVPLYAAITFRLLPSERLGIVAPNKPDIDVSTIEWLHKDSRLWIVNVSTTPPTERYVRATVTATCQIQGDGSIICVQYQVTSEEPQQLLGKSEQVHLETEARDTLREYRAASKLKDGRNSAGKWVNISLPMKLVSQ